MPEPPRSPHASARAKRRRLAAEQRAHTARILVCEPPGEDGTPLVASVRAMGYEPVACTTLADALREAARAPFDVVLVALPAVDPGHVSFLQLLRRSHAATPLVVVSADGSLEARALVQPVRPYFFAVPPLPGSELRAILSGAIEAAARA